VLRPADAIDFRLHGSVFSSLVAPSLGSSQLCGWRLTVPPDMQGAPHRPDREETLLVLDGALRVTIDGDVAVAGAGDVVLVPPGAHLQVDSGPAGATAWVTTTVGLQAELADGTRFDPPWAR
jgi:quercetin dioxygenase-like cupin family protein